MKPVALFLSAIMLFLLLVYCGLSVAEKGILELTAFQNPAGALHFKLGNGELFITFAGRQYTLSFGKVKLNFENK